MTEFFRKYDLRGKYPDQIDEARAEKVGKAYGTFTDAEKVLVGRDGRKHAEEITEAFKEGIRSTGTKVLDAGTVPTPVIYFGAEKMELESSAIVTASHNPPEYTGFKFCIEGSKAMSREGGMEQIQQIYEEESFDEAEAGEESVELKEDYIDFVSEKVDIEKGFEVVLNFGNGVASVIGRELFERLGCDVKTVNEKLDGSFPNHSPAPGDEEAQSQLRKEMDDEDLGVIFDGDGDRAGFILPGYGFIEENKLLTLFAEEILSFSDGQKVVHDLSASKLLKERVSELGGSTEEMPVGSTFISEKIHEDDNVVFAGELSGHFFFPGLDVPWDDGFFAAALMCEVVSSGDVGERLESFPEYPVSPELRIKCSEEAKKPVVEDLKRAFADHELGLKDGVKVNFESGWVLVRPSNTEEKMSIRCEADTEDEVNRLLNKVRSRTEKLIRRHEN
ncbi:MAG: phosphomannomutase/phosphoglucomutase [Candidatus Nanohaloarchaea archaeon]